LESLPRDKENIRPYDGISHVIAHRKYEEYAYVLDYSQRSKSLTVRGREGLIIQAIGEGRLTLLELLGVQNANFEVGERVYIGREGRNKIVSVLGKLEYASISQSAKNDLSSIVENIVLSNEARFVSYVNSAPPVTPRIHSLELIPGIGKTYMMGIIKEREKKTFESFLDIQTRIGIKDIHKLISRRIVEEITGEVRMNLFVGK
jgi:putative nucleotide binding protein